MKLPWAIGLWFLLGSWLILVVWALRQEPEPANRWRRWLLWLPAWYTVAGTAAIAFGLLGQMTRDLNLFLRCCFYIPLPIFGVAAILHDALLRGRAYPRLRFGFTGLGVATFAIGMLLQWGLEGVEPGERQPDDVRVLQWNVHWGGHPLKEENWEELRADIAARDPDVLILNEAPFEKKHWLEELAADKKWSLQRAACGDDPFGYQLTICARWPLACEADKRVFNGHILLVRIERPEKPLRVMVVDAESNVIRQSRVPMMQEIERIVTAAHAGGQTVDVIAGDFNTPGRSVAFDGLPHTAGGYTLAGRCSPGWRGTWPRRMPLYDIDHVWVHNTWTVGGCERFSNTRTDHRGQMVTIRAGKDR